MFHSIFYKLSRYKICHFNSYDKDNKQTRGLDYMLLPIAGPTQAKTRQRSSGSPINLLAMLVDVFFKCRGFDTRIIHHVE